MREFGPANSGVIIDWSEHFKARFAGAPLKRTAVTCGSRTVRGEAVITRRGIEGGAVYTLSRELRSATEFIIDLKPDLSSNTLAERLQRPRNKDSTSTFTQDSFSVPAFTAMKLR